jgi:diguanylate cyclase
MAHDDHSLVQEVSEARVVRSVTLASAALAILVAVAGPLAYTWLSWRAEQNDIALTARLHGAIVMQALSRSSYGWKDDVQGLLDEALVEQALPERRLIIDLRGIVVTATPPLQSGPMVTARIPLATFSGAVGELVLQRSMQPIFNRATGVAALSAALGLAIFITLRVLPLRALRRALQALALVQRRNREQLEQYANVLFEEAVDGIIVFDAEGAIQSCNRQAELLLGVSAAKLIGRPLVEWVTATYRGRPGFDVGQSETTAHRTTAAGSQKFSCEVTVNLLPSSIDSEDRYVMNLQDITERQQAAEKQWQLANFDGLTGLPNRTLFRERLSAAMSRAKGSGLQMALIFLDLDRFKNINDSLGHHAGDQLLLHVARVLSHCLRENDTVARDGGDDGLSSIVSRLGGDEFTVIVEGLQSPLQAAAVAERIRSAMEQPCFIGNDEIVTSTSIGVTLYPSDNVGLDDLLRHADLAMYAAKASGRNAIRFYSEHLSANSAERMHLETRLRHALDRNEFEIHYQPKCNLQTDKVTGVEALLRWRPDGGELVLPDRFIRVLEETGLVIQVGHWVMRQAMLQMVAWQRLGLPPIHIAVNLSARQLSHVDLVPMVETALRETGLEPQLFELELTESMLMEGTSHRETLRRLSDLGVQLAIDDFGTGYSSLRYLKSFYVDTLKVDRSFVRDTPQDPEDSAIVTAIIALAHSLNLNVVAEGVETIDQKEFLRARGCGEMQGFLLGRPMPPEVFADWLRGRYESSQDEPHKKTA